MGPGSKGLLLLAAVVVCLIGARLSAPVLVPFLFAVFLAIVTSPLVTILLRMRVPPAITVALAVVLDLAILVAVGLLVFTSVSRFDQRLPEYQKRMISLLEDLTTLLRQRGMEVVSGDLLAVFDPGLVVGFVGMLLRSAAGLLSNMILVFVILVFILVEAPGLRRKAELIAGGRETRLSGAAGQVQRYLLVKTAASIVTGLLAGFWTWVLGVDLPIVWALLAFVLNYVPAVGSIIAAVPPVLVALLMQGPGAAAAVAAGYLAINMGIGNLIEPRILGRALGLSPLVVLMSVVFWGFILGPMGALLSVPLTVAVKILLSNFEDTQWLATVLGPSPPQTPG
jgi:AI-2 transport protein TqsA